MQAATPTRLQRWQDGWSSGRYSIPGQGFHQATVHPYLLAYLDTVVHRIPRHNARILLPLCGKTVDMIYLANEQITVIGLEAIPRAIAEFAEIVEEHGGGSMERVPDGVTCDAGLGHHSWMCSQKSNATTSITIVEGDALDFELEQAKGIPMDAVWDRGALVALRVKDRQAYVEMLSNVLKPGGRILLSVVEHDCKMEMEGEKNDTATTTTTTCSRIPYGPPFSLTREDVEGLYTPFGVHLLNELVREDKLENEPRWKGKGATIFQEVCYLLEKC
jgi:thiopurine S-methyltransferase